MPCLHKEVARTYENSSYIGSYGSFSDIRKLYISFDLVQGEQPTVPHIGDEHPVGEGAFVDMGVAGIGLKQGLPGGFVDELHGNALYGGGGGIGRQFEELLQE